MKERYNSTPTKKTIDKKTVYQTTMYPKIEKKISDIYIVSTRGDRLDLYAYKYYGDSRYWPIIAQANYLGKGSLLVPTGMQIRIPRDIGDLDELLKRFQESR